MDPVHQLLVVRKSDIAALAEREREIGKIAAKLLESRPDSLQAKLNSLRNFIVLHMRDIRAIVNSDPAKTRAMLAKHIEKIALTPSGKSYLVLRRPTAKGLSSF